MNQRSIAAILLVFVVLAGAVGLGVGAYNAGVAAGLAQTGTAVAAPGAAVVPYGWGFGYGHGFGFFGFLGGLFFLFLLFVLIRVAVGGSRRGWGGPGGWSGGPGGDHRRAWEDRAREIHDDWHRREARGAGPDDAARSTNASGASTSVGRPTDATR